MQGENPRYAPSFSEALQRLVRGQPPDIASAPESAAPGDISELACKANEAFERYMELQAAQKFAEAARELDAMRDILKKTAGPQTR